MWPHEVRFSHKHHHSIPMCAGGVILALIEGIGIALTRAQSKQYKPGDYSTKTYESLSNAKLL